MQKGRSRDELIRALLPSVRKITSRLIRQNAGRACIRGDIYSAGLEGLVRAVCDFDERKGASLRGYVEQRVWGSAMDYLRGEDHLSRHYRTKAKVTGVEEWLWPLSLDDTHVRGESDMHELVADRRAEDPGAAAIARCDVAAIEAAARGLSERTQEILRLYYVEEHTQEAIGRRFGVTETRVCQLVREAHGAIRAALGEPPARPSPRAPYSRRSA